MDWKLEVVTIPVSDQERAKNFYVDKVGFNVDIDHAISEDTRLIQLTPPGSGCSIHLGDETVDMTPGSIEGLYLVVSDVHEARAELIERGVKASEVRVFDSGSFRPSREGDVLDNVGFVFFSVPDVRGAGHSSYLPATKRSPTSTRYLRRRSLGRSEAYRQRSHSIAPMGCRPSAP